MKQYTKAETESAIEHVQVHFLPFIADIMNKLRGEGMDVEIARIQLRLAKEREQWIEDNERKMPAEFITPVWMEITGALSHVRELLEKLIAAADSGEKPEGILLSPEQINEQRAWEEAQRYAAAAAALFADWDHEAAEKLCAEIDSKVFSLEHSAALVPGMKTLKFIRAVAWMRGTSDAIHERLNLEAA